MIRGLTIQDEKANGKVYYESAVLTVKGTSQYNDDQISFEEIEGFWQLPETFTGNRKPPEGTVAKFNLSTNPKRGQNAKPGSMYMDISGIYKVGDDEQPIERQQAPQSDPRPYEDEWGMPMSEVEEIRDAKGLETPAGMYRYDATHYYFVHKDKLKTEQILKGQALNLLYGVLNSDEPPAEKTETLKGMYFESIEEAKQVAGEQWNNLRLGLPAFPEPEAEPVKTEPQHEAGMAPPGPPDDGYGAPEEMPW